MGYLEAIRSCEGDGELEGRALLDLSNKVHPLVLDRYSVPNNRSGI